MRFICDTRLDILSSDSDFFMRLEKASQSSSSVLHTLSSPLLCSLLSSESNLQLFKFSAISAHTSLSEFSASEFSALETSSLLGVSSTGIWFVPPLLGVSELCRGDVEGNHGIASGDS